MIVLTGMGDSGSDSGTGTGLQKYNVFPYNNFAALVSLVVNMHTTEEKEKKQREGLRDGQLWKLEQGYLCIVEMGDKLIHYKMLRQPSTVAITQMIRPEALVNFLRHTGAQLVSERNLAAQAQPS